jgi:hypothetical protein
MFGFTPQPTYSREKRPQYLLSGRLVGSSSGWTLPIREKSEGNRKYEN